MLTEVVNAGIYGKSKVSIRHETHGFEKELTEANLVHDGDTGLLALLVELHHSGRDVGGGDDILLGADGRLDDGSVESVGNQGDGEVDSLHGLVESSIIADVEGDGLGVLEALGQLLGALEGTAS
jgi:hypothetical protein